MSKTEKWEFPSRDLARRRFQTALTVAGLAVCVSVTVFLVFFGENLGVEVTSIAAGGTTIGFSGVISRFILLVVFFNSVTGILVAYFLMAVAISERVRDIGIMKAVGCLTEVVFNYFATELLIIVFASCLLGTFGGILLNLASMSSMNFLGFYISAKPLNLWLMIVIFFSFFFVFYILGMRRIVKAAQVEPVKALSPLFVMKTKSQSTLSFPFPLSRSLVSKIAFRDLSRRRSMTLQSVACLSAVVALITLTLVGGIVADETMQSYVDRAVGRGVILVAKSEMVEHYEGLLYKFLETTHVKQVSYIDEKYVIPQSVIANLSKTSGVLRVDPRMVLEATIYEQPHFRIVSEGTSGQYIVTGDHRSSKALVVGVHSDSLVNNWLILGKNLREADVDSALVGDSLASTLFTDPWIQRFKTLNSEFKVAGVCVDPLNNGVVIYMAYDRLSAIAERAGYNLLFLQLDHSEPLSRSRVLREVRAVISGSGLTILDLNKVLERHKAFLNHIWSLSLSLSSFSFMNAILSLVGYLMLSISGQQRDLGIMRALGAKPRTALKIILFETFLLVLASGLIGLPIGLFIVFWFFIPEAVISQNALLATVGLLSALFSALCLSSLYPARKIARTPITKAIF